MQKYFRVFALKIISLHNVRITQALCSGLLRNLPIKVDNQGVWGLL